MNKQTTEGNWNITKGKLKQAYGNLTDDDLQVAEGREDEAWGRVEKKVGKTRDQIRKEIADL
ncbi:CsbD family protein [soil metagenome]